MLVCLLALGACTTEALVATAYPGRETYTFATADGFDAMSYACAPGATEAETAARARQAHSYADAELERVANAAADRIMAGVEADAPAVATSFDISRTMNREADRIVETTEARFQCVLTDVREL